MKARIDYTNVPERFRRLRVVDPGFHRRLALTLPGHECRPRAFMKSSEMPVLYG